MALEVNDAVHVTSTRQLEGVVAFMGEVEFAKGDDWVGIRLTGASVGLGKNDGSVEGVSYFSCPLNCGMFVRMANVTKRSLTRLEELRLRRELATGPTATAGAATTTAATPNTPSVTTTKTTPTRTRTTAAAAASRTSSASTTPSNTPPRERATAPISTKSKLEELRQRRAALAEKKEKEAPLASAATAPASTTVASPARVAVQPATEENSRPKPDQPNLQPIVDKLQAQLQEISEKMRAKEQDASSLQQKLSQAEQETHDARTRVVELEEAVAVAQQVEASPITVVAAAPAIVPPVAAFEDREKLQEWQDKYDAAQDKLDEREEKLNETLQEVTNLKRELEREKDFNGEQTDELTKARSSVTTLEKELQAVSDQTTQRGASDASHYKERAKLLAEISALKRKVEQSEKERIELESAVEDIALDKEQLQEEKESLEDRFEELKLDTETAQMEVEELRMELEDTQASSDRVTTYKDEAAATSEGGAKAEELAEVLTVQNLRLREALIKLREQSSIEKMEASRQLRVAEKDAQAGRALSTEVESLRSMKATFEEQINDLKDMVEEGAAFEQMVEDLSDRVLSLEEDNISLQAILREMEESGELTAEMEEVQADELKEMARDLEGRDTIIRNLEEAIKMQRRREADFQRTLGNYRTTVDTLRQEKHALLELQQGGEGEKSDLIASSQKALSRAAQLVSDAAAIRKRDAQAVMNQIDQEVYRHLSSRLESLLPQAVVASELSAVKGELLVAKAIGKASKSLEGIAISFTQAIRPGLAEIDQAVAASTPAVLQLSDSTKQEAATMIHQAEFATLVVEASSDLLRFLSAGQWPDLLNPDSSTELGSMLGHSISELDSALGLVLKSMKEEGVLTPEQSSIDSLRQTVQTTIQNLRNDIEREDGTSLSSSWNPPGWQLLKDASTAKFTCMGATASLSLVVNEVGNTSAPPGLVSLYNRLEQASAQSVNVCLRLANLDVNSDGVVDELSKVAAEWKNKSAVVFSAIQGLLLSQGDMETCVQAADSALQNLSRLSSLLRFSNLAPNEDESFHALSPEATDVWEGVSSLSRSVRAVDGDEEDVNYLLRARAIEHQLGEAVEDVPKLSLANVKLASLEKNLSTRSKEIAMQNARLSELEKLLAKSNSGALGRGTASDLKSSEEFNSMKEENRVLTEAMDVMQSQVDEYENEIRVLKDFKSPKRGQSGNRTPRRSVTSVAELSPRVPGGTGTDEMQVSSGALEAALFRPALQSALQEAAHWKAEATGSSILDLPPLPMLSVSSAVGGVNKTDEAFDSLRQLSNALSSYRLERASFKIVDLTNREKSPRVQLRESAARKAAASERLETIVMRARGRTLL